MIDNNGKLANIARDLGHQPEDVKAISVEPGVVIIVTNDGERHVYQENRHEPNPG